ncbi:nucleotide sugar dehydrogenase [Saccharothrix variisporea]|uniref:UDP-N-acetyl-D-glucosamine dehydrogenase n=1 Tax=Saccharothrix variisporea TaxID=543527 RepID=A0A495X3I8_9PSEU|nr:nucleotide sugar dehydrogenase [Saccharothrix variisporea]RKT68467.1 UDP-N-acetyl-D-glucosamine dehydrogenase [Saccharothrix variisporea]
MDSVDVVVVGLGVTGLSTAVAAARVGFRVVGLDSAAGRVRDVAAVRPGCGLGTVSERELGRVLAGGRLEVRGVDGGVPAADVHVLCLPTPSDGSGRVDRRALISATRAVGGVLRNGDLVLVQSSCPPGTTAGAVVPELERVSGLRAGVGFSMACAPSRLDPGSPASARATRVVGGCTEGCAERAGRFLRALGHEVVEVSGARVAELVKLFENTFRLVNISLVNELAAVCGELGVDVDEVLRAAGSKGFGFLGHRPSAGAGGDCVPVAARVFGAVARQVGLSCPVVDAAVAVNDAMPAHTVHRLRQAVGSLGGKRVLVLGVTYKPDVPDIRRSAAIAVLEELRREAEVAFHDPYVDRVEMADGTVLGAADLRRPERFDLVVLMTPHAAYRQVGGWSVPVVDCSSGHPVAWGGVFGRGGVDGRVAA